MSNIDKQATQVSRYDLVSGYMQKWPDGEFVYHSDYLALLDELEAKDRRLEEEIGRANREHHRGFMMACRHLKEHSNVHYADAAEMEIAALRKRINELESAAAGKGEAS
ncbi:ead/Ea22-like family protein [Enterobacter roggenkampii]